MQTEDKSAQIILLRTLGSVLVLMVLGMTAARIFGWLDISGVLIVSLLTVAVSNWTIAHAISKKEDEAE
jgi:hypothetical protein